MAGPPLLHALSLFSDSNFMRTSIEFIVAKRGTNFCSLAEKNLPKKAQPHYYCMPDMGWSGNKNAGYCEIFFVYDG